MGFEISQSHIALATSNDVKEICMPLEKLGITYFSFVRSYKNGSHIRLSNNPAWTNHYYKRGFYNVVLKQVPDSEGSILWSNIEKFPLFYEASEFYDVDNGTVIVLNIDDVTERYFFGSTKANTKINGIYIHHIDLLKRFILYFKEAGKSLIDRAEKAKIIIPKQHVNDDDNNIIVNTLIDDFLNETKVDKICIRANGHDFYISNNEARILALMKSGRTAKEISSEVGLSRKTVEIYRDKLKIKLDLFTRGNLISIARSNTLLSLNLLDSSVQNL